MAHNEGVDPEEMRRQLREWVESFDAVVRSEGKGAALKVLRHLERRARLAGIELPFVQETAYLNTIAAQQEPSYDGELELEERIENLVRWNAMAMVVRANERLEGIGGHISTYASAATLFEVGFNHFFRGDEHPEGPDQVFFQGHASPGVYARAFLEGRFDEVEVENFRRELQPEGGVSSYPHPWLMEDFWEFPSVSMGLAPTMAVYQARFNRYLEARGLAEKTGRVWALVGDGEMDEPESVGPLRVAAREGLSNLVMVVNCNLQRLDGPVVGNSKIIQELEAMFRGAGWRVLKVIWGGRWEPLLEEDVDGLLAERMEEVVDGDYQRYAARGGAHLREHFFGAHEQLEQMVSEYSDRELEELGWGGHDIRKVHAAYRVAEEESQRPVVILAKTVKGYGLGEAGEARNVSHKTKSMKEGPLRRFRDRFDIPVPDDRLEEVPFYRPADDSPEIEYMLQRREELGGPVPNRRVRGHPLEVPPADAYQRLKAGSSDRKVTTTVLMVRLLKDLLGDENIGEKIVPIIPDEARTFGVEALFPQVGIYASEGQKYEPVDADSVLSYRESPSGQILEEGITEAGAMSSTIAAGTAYATHGINAIPFFFFYSMFGFQRVGDFIWAAGDSRTRGFLVGATSGRTTLNGEGLQHQDGHSHLTAMSHPAVRAWDPAFGYELAVIVEDGLERMYAEGHDEMYYITVANRQYRHPPMPDGVRDGILRGMYRLESSAKSGKVRRAHILASGPIIEEAIEAREILESDFGVTADLWSVTSWKELYQDAVQKERHNQRHPQGEQRIPYLRECLGEDPGAVVAVSDYVKALPSTLGRWVPGRFVALGTDGFGRSDSVEALRDFFEVDTRHIVVSALAGLVREGRYSEGKFEEAMAEYGIESGRGERWRKR